MALAFATSSEILSGETPQLVPFHIDYSGPAPISTYFLVGDTPSPPNSMPFATIKRAFSAAFRGRLMHGINVMIPESYMGLAVRIDALAGTSDSTNEKAKKSSKLKRTQTDGLSPTKAKRRVKESLMVPQNLRRTRGRAVAHEAMIISAAETGDENSYAMMSDVVIGQEDVNPAIVSPEDISTTRFMTPVGVFNSVNVWHPDVPIDDARDEYLRCMDEWTRLAQVVRAFLLHVLQNITDDTRIDPYSLTIHC